MSCYGSQACNAAFFDEQQLDHRVASTKTTGKKSLPLAYIEKNGIEIIPGIAPRIPYLKAVDQFLSMKEND